METNREIFIKHLQNRVEDLRKEVLSNDTLFSKFKKYFKLRSEIYSINNKIATTIEHMQTHKDEFLKNEIIVRTKLENITKAIITDIRKICKAYLGAAVDEHNKSIAYNIEKLKSIIENNCYKQVISAVKEYKELVRSVYDFEKAVNQEIVKPLARISQELLRDDLFNLMGDRTRNGAESFSAEIRALFKENVFNKNQKLFMRNIDIIQNCKDKKSKLKQQLSGLQTELNQSIIEALDLKDVFEDIVGKFKHSEFIKDMKQYLINPLMKLPENILKKITGPQELKNIINHKLGNVIKRNIMKQLKEILLETYFISTPRHGKKNGGAHYCGAPCKTKEEPCHRKTTNDLCYQHDEA